MITTTFNRQAMIRTFANLLEQNHSRFRGWIEGDGYGIYVRINERYVTSKDLDSVKLITLDLANINFASEYQSKGNFTALLTWLEKNCKYPLYIENTMTKRFQQFFIKRGYEVQPKNSNGIIKSFLYLKDNHEG